MIQSEIHKVYKYLVFARFKGFLESVATFLNKPLVQICILNALDYESNKCL